MPAHAVRDIGTLLAPIGDLSLSQQKMEQEPRNLEQLLDRLQEAADRSLTAAEYQPAV